MPEYRSRVFDSCTNVEVLTLRVVRGNEIETAGVFVVKTGRNYQVLTSNLALGVDTVLTVTLPGRS